MKKHVSLFLALILSVTVFLTDMMGITMIVRAEDGVDAVFEDFDEDGDFDDAVDDGEYDYQKWVEEQAAKEAEEAARQAAEDEAAREAQRQAEEQEKARQEAEEAGKQDQGGQTPGSNPQSYSLVVDCGGNPVSSVDMGSCPVGQQRDYRPVYVVNTGANPIDLVYMKTGDADAAFSLSLHGDKTHLEPGETASYNLSMRPDLPAGTYNARVVFGASFDTYYSQGTALNINGTVTPKQASVTSVTINPSKATVAVGGIYDFGVAVSGTGDFDPSVRWSLSGNRSTGTTISANGPNGRLVIANDETSSSITVMASSIANGNVVGYATVTPQRNSYNVMTYVDPANGGYVTGGGAVSQGGSVTVSAVPNNNYYFTGWDINGKIVSTATNYTISNVTANMGITARFAQRSVNINVGVNNTNGGTVAGGGTVTYGGSTTISAKAYSGYVFTGWVENNQVISREASLKLTDQKYDRKITACFEQTSHTLTVTCNPGDAGTVSGGGTFKLGTGTTVKASPKDGYNFVGWYVGGQVVSRDASYNISRVDQDFTITAVFEKKGITSYEISSGVATTGGNISPAGKTLVAQGEKFTYTITPKSGFAILAVAVDGKQVGAVSSYTFTNVQGPHTISAAFVQTDAGKTAAASSGKNVQQEKVQTVAKTSSNTATATSTVDVNEAARGEGGDEYVEEMDLTDVYIPTDEELGITEEPVEVYSEVTQMLGMSLNEVQNMVASGNTMPVLDAAFYTGALGAYVQNEYEPKKLISVDYQNMTTEELMLLADDSINPSLPDLDVVVQRMLTEDEVMSMAKGGHVSVAVSLTQQEADSVTQRIMKNAVGQKPLQYFDLTMLKTAGGYTERVTELPTTMEVVMEIPDEIYQSGRTYSILRVHNGELSVLPDLDDDPKTITFRTDRFSSYAIAREVGTTKSILIWLIAGAAIAFGIAMTCFMILVSHQRRWRKANRRAH